MILLTWFPFRAAGVVTIQKIVVHLLTAFSGFDRIRHLFISAQVIRFILESDLRRPFLGFGLPVHTSVTAGVRGNRAVFHSLQQGNRGAIYQAEIVPDDLFLQTAAAFGLSALQKGLADDALFAAVAKAPPAVHSIPLSGVFQNSQHTEPFSYIILQGRMT